MSPTQIDLTGCKTPLISVQRLLGGRFYRIHINGAILATTVILTGEQARMLARELVASGYFDEKTDPNTTHLHTNPDNPHNE